MCLFCVGDRPTGRQGEGESEPSKDLFSVLGGGREEDGSAAIAPPSFTVETEAGPRFRRRMRSDKYPASRELEWPEVPLGRCSEKGERREQSKEKKIRRSMWRNLGGQNSCSSKRTAHQWMLQKR